MSTATEKKSVYFRLLVGVHYDRQNRYYNAKDPLRCFVPGDPGENLAKKFGHTKFEMVQEGTRIPPYPAEVEEDEFAGIDDEADVDMEAVPTKPLDKMNVSELKAFAEERELDLGPAVTKQEILGVIREQLMG
jgi:hypothetical protein